MLRPNWFDQGPLGQYSAQAQFERFLLPLQRKADLYFIQIGVFAGDASLWLCQNVLGPSSCLDDVDIWDGDYQGSDQSEVEAYYDRRMVGYDRVRKHKMSSRTYLTDHCLGDADFIYIDGNHEAAAVLEDAVLAWPHLKSGGIMAFDDYSDLGVEHEHPHIAIEAFLSVYGSQLEILSRALQVWVRKR